MSISRPCSSCPVKGEFLERNQTCSVGDPGDGQLLTCVGEWALEKHERLKRYIDISKAARRKFVNGRGGASYIELYSGAGKSRIKGTEQIIFGSALVATESADDGGVSFNKGYFADANLEFGNCLSIRLGKNTTPFKFYHGCAKDTVSQIVRVLEPNGLHLAFLDPYNLSALPSTILEELSKLKRMDMLIHVSLVDLHRNLRSYISNQNGPLDIFIRGWRSKVDTNAPDFEVRRQLLECWINNIRLLGFEVRSDSIEKVTGATNQPLYLLVFASKNKIANDFWEKIRNISPQRQLGI